MTVFRGKPEDHIGRVFAKDVIPVLRDLEEGAHPAEELYGAYVAHVLADERTPGTIRCFSAFLAKLGCRREDVWMVDPVRLRRKWHPYPWDDPEPDQAEMPPGPRTMAT